ncbi:MAG: DUF6391 domain-containing protein [Dehalococcoidia bacterium]|nr:DUF6391 domain-containing protein [Dehalococcoidia bacterium]
MEVPFLSRLRRNHALEHATIAVLHQRRGRVHSSFGHSTPWSFHLHGPYDADEVESAVGEALDRLRAGERHLAYSPFCGTNIAVTGVLTASTALVAAGRSRRKGWSNAVLAATFATLVAARAGLWLQRTVTTDPEAGSLRVRRVVQLAPRGDIQHVRVDLAP